MDEHIEARDAKLRQLAFDISAALNGNDIVDSIGTGYRRSRGNHCLGRRQVADVFDRWAVEQSDPVAGAEKSTFPTPDV